MSDNFTDINSNENHKDWFQLISQKITAARVATSIKVNTDLLQLYYDIGSSIIDVQDRLGWGSQVIDKLSHHINNKLPGSKGFSVRNLKYMRAFAQAYPDFPMVQVPLAQNQKVQVSLAQIPWYHHISLLTKVKSLEDRLFYIQETATNGWSRDTMLLQIKSNLHLRQGSAITNFEHTLPEIQSDLAKQTIKDPYVFDFLTLSDDFKEKELENQLIEHVSKFLLELGKGFAFLGKQYHLEIASQDYYIDLLFYHTTLKCYVVIELKNTKFLPEYAGKLNFYLSAVDDTLKQESDQPSIGILLCRDKNNIEVEFALRGMSQPMGVSEFNLTEVLPDNLKSSLPTVEELEKELEKE
jgi:predicted nuclease of restriction endonuclease-like (RecB) superfamily